MSTGKVKFFNAEKGFGFITRDDGQDIFVHVSKVTASGISNLREGDIVEFDEGSHNGKTHAQHLTVTGHEERQTREYYSDDGGRGYSDRGSSRGYESRSQFEARFDRDWAKTRYK